MELIDHEELVTALEELVGVYGERMAPYALTLAKKLTENYRRLIEFMAEDEEASFGD